MERLVPHSESESRARTAGELSMPGIERMVHHTDPSVLFVEPRILRRVIMQDRRMSGLGIHVPHSHVYTIDRERLLMIVERQELDLSPAAELPPHVILIPRPTENENFARLDTSQRLHFFWRLVFHGRVHAHLELAFESDRLPLSEVTRRMQRMGEAEWSEVRTVLEHDGQLLPPMTEQEIYSEFVAIALELKYFAPADRSAFFPSVRDWDAVDEMIGREVPHGTLFETTRPPGAADSLHISPEPPQHPRHAPLRVSASDAAAPDPDYRRLLMRADEAGRRGNQVKAAILAMEAAALTGGELSEQARERAAAELGRLTERLQAACTLDPDSAATWRSALTPLLQHVRDGYRTAEARLLYDLQKVCLSLEKGVYRIDLWRWIRSFGREPMRQNLTLLRGVLSVKNLRTAQKRVSSLQISTEEREAIRHLLEHQIHCSEEQVRNDIRPTIDAVLEEVGLIPENVPEQIARKKIVEELLDSIVERGFAGIGDLRDAISRNDLKLPDVAGTLEPLLGDKLLKADKRLGQRLDQVYRKGPIYLRLPQRLSSIAFGTHVGRFLTEFIALPFGIAFVALEAIKHIVGMFQDPPPLEVDLPLGAVTGVGAQLVTHLHAHHRNGPLFYVAFLTLGFFLLLLQQNERFRTRVTNALHAVWSSAHWLLVDLPSQIVNAPVVQRILRSQFYGVLRNYVFRPAIATAIFTGLAWVAESNWSQRTIFEVFLATNLFLNSPIGRYFEEWLTDLFVRAWHELRMRVFAATFYWIMDNFHRLMRGLEQVIYVVDEWLRFRSGDPRRFVVVKALLGMIWGVVSYLVRIYVTLLIEPQINPVKHFPVVTVTHKMMLPFYPVMTRVMVDLLSPLMGYNLALVFAAVNLFLLPGVFGFLVWELKGNWGLYAANRPTSLHPARFGHHGETMTALLRPGFHSGTLPKLFSKLRGELRVVGDRNHDRNVEHYRDGLEVVETAVGRFVDRTFCELLRLEDGETFADLRIRSIGLATNRIEIAFDRRRDDSGEPLVIEFEELGNWLCARIVSAGWLTTLRAEDRDRLNAALSGLYKLAGVELVHEHLDPVLRGIGGWKEFTPHGLVVHNQEHFERTATYAILSEEEVLLPQQESSDGHPAWPILTRREAIFDETEIAWKDWVAIWSRGEDRIWPDKLPYVLPGRSGVSPSGIRA